MAASLDTKSVLARCIAANNLGAECIERNHHARAITTLRTAFAALIPHYSSVVSSYKGEPLPRENNSQQLQAHRPLFDIDALFPVQPETVMKTFQDADSTQAVYAGPIRIPVWLSSCNDSIYTLKLVVSFNLALSYHLLALNGKEHKETLFRRAYINYQLALGLQPDCARCTRGMFQIATMHNLGSICASLGEDRKKEAHLGDVTAKIVFMTCHKNVDVAVYEVFLEAHSSLICGSNLCSGAA